MLSAVRILGVCGSLQAESANLALLRTAAASAPDGVDVVLYDGLRQLPHFDPDTDASGEPPSVRDWRQALADSDAVLIASPEYGHSLPGALKNAIDWVICSGGLERQVVAIPTARCGRSARRFPAPSAVGSACRRFARRSARCARRSSAANRFRGVQTSSDGSQSSCASCRKPPDATDDARYSSEASLNGGIVEG